jgi:hypothetical protein
MDMKKLAEAHKEACATLWEAPVELLLLWYADLGLEVEGGRVAYHCPGCGTRRNMALDEFLLRDSSDDLRCNECRGYLEERGGPMG